tara:strand:+ start:51 stop:1046 length:996 start_codon:yes stop_codon:yes gene_type:complete
MVIYECKRCGYIGKQRGHLIKHLNRKNLCNPIYEDVSVEYIKNLYNFNKIQTPQKDSKIFQNDSKIFHQIPLTPKNQIPNDSKMAKNHTFGFQNIPKNGIQNKCLYCCKEYSNKGNLNKHLKSCTMKKKNLEDITLEHEKDKIELMETVEKLIIECSEMKNIINNNKTISSNNNSNNTNSHNTTNNTTNNIININNYGDENTKYITKDFIMNLLKNKPFKAIPELIKHTHFNNDYPENQNIKLTNKKEPYVKIMKDNKWELQDRKETITDLIDKQQIHLTKENIEGQIESECNSNEKKNIKRCNELYNEDDKDYMKRLYNESELIVINNST